MTVFVKPTFLQEWQPKDFEDMQRSITRYYAKKSLISVNGKGVITPKTWEGLNELFGLAYTSSSSFAGYWVCNVELSYNGFYNVIGFAIGKDGKHYAVAWDKDEHELIFEL